MSTARTPDVTPFDVCGPLPEGTAVLEASAGTGKTFTIAALATRYVAEGLDLSQIMLVTFSRAATQELRERVRERFVTAERGLSDPRRARAGSDALLRLLADVPDDDVAHRRRRLARALADFDTATIATTHGFCQQMLTGLGMAGDTDPDAAFVERIDDVVTEVVADLYLRKFAAGDGTLPAIDYACARKVARDAMQDRHAALVAHDRGVDPAAHQRSGLAEAVRREVDTRKRSRRLLDYDDLLSRLRDTLVDPVRGPSARERIRARYRVVLVDEFQDTDPVQWQILRTTFHGTTTLVLIGDPKQAIYAFRGADLVTYLDAAADATTRRTLARSWRSDQALLTAFSALFGGAALGHADIVVRPVEAEHTTRRLTGAPSDVPLRLRVAGRHQAEQTRKGVLAAGAARRLVAEDLAADVAGLLASPATLDHGAGPRQVSPGDVAVLVRTNGQAVLVRDSLAKADVPAVLTGSSSVFLTRSAQEWLVLLHALEQPHRAGLVRAAALTCFVGWTAERLGGATDEDLDGLGQRLRSWRDVLAGRGVAALLEVVTATAELAERLLATPSGERDLTDVRHIAETLHAAAVGGQLGPSALVEWLQRRVREAAEDSAEERSRRLESDADAVQVVTIHSSKGLEFPLVYVPFGWDRHVGTTPDPLRLHGSDGTRLLDVGGPSGEGYDDRKARHEDEECGEDLRLLYVAWTRARCQVVAWWAPSTNTPHSALHRLLFGSFAPGQQPPDQAAVPDDHAVRRVLEQTAAGSSGTIAVEPVADDRRAVWQPERRRPAHLSAAVFERALDSAWRRTSYTGLTSAVHEHAGVGSEPEVPEREDEATLDHAPAPAESADEDDQRLRAVPSPMADLPGGAAFGTLVHQILERVDTTAEDLAGEVRSQCDQAVAGRLAGSVDAATLAAALLPVLETPLGPLAGQLRLRDIAPADRLAELDFELPLAGGDDPQAGDGTLASIADLLARQLPPTGPVAGYADALRAPGLRTQRLRGYLAGSIDAVLRVRGDDGTPRYLVVDYKTNWLGAFTPAGPEPLTAWHYRPSALDDAMVRAHYPLQALLYSAALHRFLRWRQPGYDPDRHLGGILYLFTRGMCGPATPLVDGAPCGVFSWQPPAALVDDLSRLLEAGVA